MMFAIIATGGKQINVEVGKEYFVEKLAGNANDKIIFDQVLMIDGTVGKPFIKGAEVHATIIKQDKAKKIIVFKYKPKKNSKTKYGHRQPYTKVKITDIFLSAKDKENKEKSTQKEIKEVKVKTIKKATTSTTAKVEKPKKVVKNVTKTTSTSPLKPKAAKTATTKTTIKKATTTTKPKVAKITSAKTTRTTSKKTTVNNLEKKATETTIQNN